MRTRVFVLVAALALWAGGAAAQSSKMLLVGMSWVPAQGGSVPANALVTGFTPREFLYSCRGTVENGVHLGKIRAGLAGCLIPVGGREQTVTVYEVLSGPPQKWIPATTGDVPARAVDVGRTASGQPLYVCRGVRNNELVPGKTGAGLRGCNVGVGGREVVLAIYEVLIQ